MKLRKINEVMESVMKETTVTSRSLSCLSTIITDLPEAGDAIPVQAIPCCCDTSLSSNPVLKYLDAT